MKLSEKQMIFTLNISKLIKFCFDNDIELTFGEAYRTEYQQKHYLETGKSKTMKSNHLKRLAVDFNFFINGELTYNKKLLEKVGFYWESLNENNRWGGNFKSFIDTPHFEMN
jgi:hypothetical protein